MSRSGRRCNVALRALWEFVFCLKYHHVYMPWGILYSAITLTKRIEVFYHCMYTGGVSSSPTLRSHTSL